MKPIDQLGSPEIQQITASRTETPEARARRLEGCNAMRESVTSPTRRLEPRGIDWGIVAVWVLLLALSYGTGAWLFAMFFGG